MKRLILLFLPFVSICINAEELKFVTVLSSPVGTFNKLEAVNPAVPAKSPTINFCTSIGNGGTVTLQGKDSAKHPTMSTVNMSSNTELGGNGGNYVLNRITMNKGGVLKGSRLLANTLQVGQPTSGKSENLYINNLTVAGAKTNSLHIDGTQSYYTDTPLTSDPGMVWSNQYQNDKACGSTTECAKQYLLKENRTSSTDPCAGEKARTYWNGSACVCPSAGRPSPVGYLPEYDTCCYLDGEKKEPCWKKGPQSTCSGYKWAQSPQQRAHVSCNKTGNGGSPACWIGSLGQNTGKTVSCDLAELAILASGAEKYCNLLSGETEGGECSPASSSVHFCASGVSVLNGAPFCSFDQGGNWSGEIGFFALHCQAACETEETWQPQWINK